MNKKIEVKCPICKKLFEYSSSKWRPFCSERCREVDLGHWISGNYSVPSKEKLSDEELEKIERLKKDE